MPIIEDRASVVPMGGLPPWQLLIVDDDETVHRATRFALEDFSFEDRPLDIMSAYSANQARELIANMDDVAVVLLDVVMETEYVGLEFVRWVRDELSNPRVRIVMRTGQPGFAPELQVIRDYDINDYKEKSGLTNTKLLTTIYAALRAFRDIVHLEKQSDELREALVAVEEANMAKMSFISHMSHEFRTPLNGIIGLSEMIATEALGPVGTEKYREYAWD
ncbi:MAG: response regulator, partial [Minwuia sp.]|nr:response regulator [Minwuia sp.]